MVSFNKFFTTVFLAVIYSSSSMAAPRSPTSSHATHRKRTMPNGLELMAFQPPTTYSTFGQGIAHPLSKRDDSSIEDAAVAFVTSQLGVGASALKYKSGFAGETSKQAYLKQSYDGVDFANAVANVAFNDKDMVVAFGHSFVPVSPNAIASSTPTLSSADAIAAAEKATGGKYNEYPTELEYYAKEDGTVVLTHVVQIEDEDTGSWHEMFIDAHSGEPVSATDFVAQDSYLVLPFQKEYPEQGFEVVYNPQDTPFSSLLGWHLNGSTLSTDTSGNNAISYKASQSATTKESSPGLNFHYELNPAVEPTEDHNLDAARVNSFYIVNSVHDFAYRYGFTESAYNFQADNFGRGGEDHDRVLISVQDKHGINNADFSTPKDGQHGRMRMFLWNHTMPFRDGALENDIVVHEMTHGITNRMTGGGTGRCLQTNEAGGLGEGWSDAMAHWTETTSDAVPDYTMGAYVVNRTAGIRSHPYSTSATTNPLRYSSIKSQEEVHDIGEVWANMLFNVYAALVKAYGWSPVAKTNPYGREGNVVFLHLFIDALPLQPCNPTFVTARDAWIQADENRYGGANKCILWNAFASRGLGVNAKHFKDDSSVPKGC